uniref:JmjC domain-containing protein 7 n=1 Tax=Ciona intestinalis TaxID=7719 RepID=F7AR17_CIOIN|nr:jmjC domain-containing protein 7 [Ciona intestinalis]|eukprot:XP_002129610.1 jmjC domain-containing protein 7 [Ciona intestinalis]
MLCNSAIICVLFVLSVNSADPVGHLQPLGSHMDPLPIEVLDTMPNPIDFFDNYVQKSKPVLFRGAAFKFPSFESWRSDDYLSKKYGNWKIVAEEGKKEDRDLGTMDMTFKKFLQIYKKTDIYLVQDVLPPNPMTTEVYLPKCLLCGGFTDYLNTMVMWFSSGGTKSVLHNDGFENINCLYDGSKELVMIDKKYKDMVPMDKNGYSGSDVEKVDMYKYPTLGKVPWHLAKMESGDCFYIPYQWFHHVNSSTTRNLAINIWWSQLYDLPQREQCMEKLDTLPDAEQLFKYKIAPGIEMSRNVLFESFDEETKTTTKSNFVKQFVKNVLDGSEEMNEAAEAEAKTIVEAFFDNADTDKDGVLTVAEAFAVSSAELKEILGDKGQEFFEEGQYGGVGPTEENAKEEL